MGRPDSTRREHEVVAGAHRLDLRGDGSDVVGNGDDALDVHSERAQPLAQEGRVCVDDLAGEDFVADHENAGAGHGRAKVSKAAIRAKLRRSRQRRAPPTRAAL